MLYAGDTVILAETDDDLQNALNIYALYCEIAIISGSTRMKLK